MAFELRDERTADLGSLGAIGVGALGLALAASRIPEFIRATGMHDFDYAAAQIMIAFGGILMVAAPLAKRGLAAAAVLLVGGSACVLALGWAYSSSHGHPDITQALWIVSVATVGLAALAVWWSNRIEPPPEPLTGTLDNPLGFVPRRVDPAAASESPTPTRRRRPYRPKI